MLKECEQQNQPCGGDMAHDRSFDHMFHTQTRAGYSCDDGWHQETALLLENYVLYVGIMKYLRQKHKFFKMKKTPLKGCDQLFISN